MSSERSGREPNGESCAQGPGVYPVARHSTRYQGTAQLTESVESQLAARSSTLPVQALRGLMPVRALAFAPKAPHNAQAASGPATTYIRFLIHDTCITLLWMTNQNGTRMFHDQDASAPRTTLVRLPIKTHEPLYDSGCV
jgi:hypothetical protein